MAARVAAASPLQAGLQEAPHLRLPLQHQLLQPFDPLLHRPLQLLIGGDLPPQNPICCWGWRRGPARTAGCRPPAGSPPGPGPHSCLVPQGQGQGQGRPQAGLRGADPAAFRGVGHRSAAADPILPPFPSPGAPGPPPGRDPSLPAPPPRRWRHRVHRGELLQNLPHRFGADAPRHHQGTAGRKLFSRGRGMAWPVPPSTPSTQASSNRASTTAA